MLVAMARPHKMVVVVTGDPVAAVQSERGDYGALFKEAAGASWSGAWEVVDARSEPLKLADTSAVIITGSSASVHQREPWMLDAEAELRRLVARGAPVLGVCFGHQLLAQALGGEVQPNERGREMSTVAIERLADDPIFSGLGQRFSANACHSDTVVRLPEGATVLAANPGDRHQCLRFAERCYGVQFHPEFDSRVMRAMIDARRSQLDAEGLDEPALMARASDTPEARRVLENFLALAATQ